MGGVVGGLVESPRDRVVVAGEGALCGRVSVVDRGEVRAREVTVFRVRVAVANLKRVVDLDLDAA